MLDPEVNLRLIAPKRRNTGNPWFKRGTLYRPPAEAASCYLTSGNLIGTCCRLFTTLGAPSGCRAGSESVM